MRESMDDKFRGYKRDRENTGGDQTHRRAVRCGRGRPPLILPIVSSHDTLIAPVLPSDSTGYRVLNFECRFHTLTGHNCTPVHAQ
jgi:hypothetical protein